MSASPDDQAVPPSSLRISVVVPVYRGAQTIAALVGELADFTEPTTSPSGLLYQVDEVILVWDHGPDRSDEVIRELAAKHPWVRPVWLSRNYGQHAATIAGMAASGGDWVVTMDEDGQHDPEAIGTLLDAGYQERVRLVYAAPSHPPPHGWLRNLASQFAKTVVLRLLTGGDVETFHSYRLLSGDVARAVAAYAGPGVYLDVALSWVVTDVTTVPVEMRAEGRPATSYRFRALLSHFWRLVLSSGNRPLRMVSGFGAICATLGLLYAIWIVAARLSGTTEVAGWTSMTVTLLIIGGVILVALGVIAEYVGLAATMSMGKPNYVVLDDQAARFGGSGTAAKVRHAD